MYRYLLNLLSNLPALKLELATQCMHFIKCFVGRILIEDSDQNLKYLGLLAMSKILKTSPKSVASHKVRIVGWCQRKKRKKTILNFF